MGFFHKTLERAIGKLNDNNYREAIEILESHINGEHQADSDLMLLKKAIDQYNEKITTAKANLERINNIMNREAREKEKVSALNSMHEAIVKLEKVETIVRALRDDTKRLR